MKTNYLLLRLNIIISFCSLFFATTINAKTCAKVKPVDFNDLTIKGELITRIQKNFDRLEETKYQPDHVFLDDKQSGHWPGDTEGRTILGLIQNSRSSKRTPLYLEEIIRRVPQHLNAKGYMGKIHPDGVLDEQQLSGIGWLIRGLCEYYEQEKNPQTLQIVKTIIDSLFIPSKGLYSGYPINPETRNLKIGEAMGNIYKSHNNWYLSTDVGCVFIGMDGIIHAYKHLPSVELRAVIDEMVNRFLEMDLLSIKAQTHASLTAMRGLLTYATLTDNYSLVEEVEKRWQLYLSYGMMENFANYNWFRRYDAASEPCAIVDSYIVALMLWELTQKEEYLPYLDLIYYNALAHAQRNNGGFGTDCFKTPDKCHLTVNLPEAHWCCTMRGADGLANVAQSSYYFNTNSVYFLHFIDSEAIIRPSKGKSIKISQKSEYPFKGKITLKLTNITGTENIQLKFKLPSQWVDNLKITRNGKKIKSSIDKGFVVLQQNWANNDSISIIFNNKLQIVKALNKEHYPCPMKKIMFGPLLLGTNKGVDRILPEKIKVQQTGHLQFSIVDTDILLNPVYHLMNPSVIKGDGYNKQVIFKTEITTN